jgi:hypothetical protein
MKIRRQSFRLRASPAGSPLALVHRQGSLRTKLSFRSIAVGFAACWLVLAATVAEAAELPSPGRPDNRIRFCGFGGNGRTLDMLTNWWPNLEYCRAYDPAAVPATARLAAEAQRRGVRFSLQSVAPVLPEGYLDQHDCWAIDFLNRKPPALGIAHPVADYCHPATVAALKGDLEVAFREMGASSFTMVDFVWPYVGGNWGYSEACFASYRAALAGTDGGLRVAEAGGERALSFWDYFAELSGLRFTPQELGCKSWQEFEPVRPNRIGNPPTDTQRRNAFLFRGLIHYCWLRYAQEAGAHAKKLGGELQASLNPENSANGTDLLMWGRLADTGEPWMEEWGSPWTAMAGYHTYRYFMEPYRTGRKRAGLIAETGAAGGHPDSGFGPARPHYWDPNSNYALSWALGAAGQFDDREEDYIYASPQETLDPAGPQADCWRGYVKGMDGFWQYALDKPRRPVAPILSIVNRSILHESDSSEQSINRKYSLAPPLVEMHVDFEQGYFPLSDTLLAGRKVLLFAPWDYPRAMLPRLQRWLAENNGRLLVTHSFVPARPCRGLTSAPHTELDEPAAAEVLGLRGLRFSEVRKGKISSVDAEWKGLFPLAPGTELTLDRPLVACAGKALVRLGDAPLVTKVEGPSGGTVIYLNFTPPEHYNTGVGDSARLLRAVLEAITRQAGIEPQAEGASTWACARYDLTTGHAYLLLDRARLTQTRFTEETASLDPAAKLSLRLNPRTAYRIYDVLAGTIAERKADDAGRLEVFLSGRSIRLLYVMPSVPAAQMLFTTCERQDGRPRTELPARLHAHRAGKAVVTGLPEGTGVYLDGRPAFTTDTALPDSRMVLVGQGDHLLEVRLLHDGTR